MTDEIARSILPLPDAATPASAAYLALADEATALVAEADSMVRVAPTPRLDRDEPLPEAASLSRADPRADAALLPSLARGPSDPLLELRPADVARSLARLPASAHAEVLDLARLMRVFERAATPATTRRIYINRLSLFVVWCEALGARAMPAHPEVLRQYLVSLAAEQKALSTIEVSMAAISMAHRALGHEPPMSDALRITVRSLRRTLGPQRPPSTSISLAMLRQLVASCENDPHGIRDRALILVTFFACLRRADAVGLNREGAQREERGYWLTYGRKAPYRTDAPTLVLHAEPSLCPVRALDDWLGLPAIWVRGLDRAPTCGPVFVGLHRGRRQRFHVGDRLAPNDLDRIVKRRAVAAGLNPAGLSAASLRPGFSPDAALGDTSSVA